MESPSDPEGAFRVLRNGRVRIPDRAAELLIILMIYTPNSWAETAARLRCLPVFQSAMSVYSLVYTFCVAMNSCDPLLLNFALYDENTRMYSMVPHVASMYDGEPKPLDFWSSIRGQELRAVAADVSCSAHATFEDRGLFQGHDLVVIDFCNLVDNFRNVPHSVSDHIIYVAFANTNLLVRLLTGLLSVRARMQFTW